MNNVRLFPLNQPFQIRLHLPGSKSLTNRALIMAALCREHSMLQGLLESDDTQACRKALEKIHTEKKIFCHDAGTVLRFLLPVCAALGGEYFFDGSSRLRERPIQPLITLLQQQGIVVEFLDTQNALPLRLHSSGLPGGKLLIDTQDSTQFLSGLCIAAPLMKNDVEIQSSEAIAHQPYVLMTLKLMKHFGISVTYLDTHTLKFFPQEYKATTLAIEPDASTASYFFAAAALTQSTVVVENLSMNSVQGDLQFLGVLKHIGCQIHSHTHGSHSEISVTGPQQFQALSEINMRGFSDTFMTLAIIAPFLPTPTTLHGLRHTRLQESDRVLAISEGLQHMGIHTESTEDSLTIFPMNPSLTLKNIPMIRSHHDHRIAMAFSILGLKIPGVVIEDAECVSKTCPLFFQYLEQLGVKIHVQ